MLPFSCPRGTKIHIHAQQKKKTTRSSLQLKNCHSKVVELEALPKSGPSKARVR